MGSNNTVTVIQIRSTIRSNKLQRVNLKGLGLRKIGSVSVLKRNPSILGMINKVKHLVSYKFD